MAVNKDPFVRTKNKDGLPGTFRGLVQAGSTQAIKIGEICCLNKTAGYWVPISAVNDFIYALAIAREEQKAADGSRYIEFYSLDPADEFEFELDAARALALGDCFVLTASYSQKLTYSATAYPVARCVDDGHYPQEEDTTIRNRSYAVVSFNPACTYWGLISPGSFWGSPKQIVSASALTLYNEMSGLMILNTGAGAAVKHVLPDGGRAGCRFKAYTTVAQDHGFDPQDDGAIIVEGAAQTDGQHVTTDALGDCLEVVCIGSEDWVALASITSAADQTGAIDVNA